MQHDENIVFSTQRWCEDFEVNVCTSSVTFRSIVDLHGCISILLSSKLEFVTLIYADNHKIHLDFTC